LLWSALLHNDKKGKLRLCSRRTGKRKGEYSMTNEVIIYGSDWCGYTQRALRQLDSLGVSYQYIDVDSSPEDEKRIAGWNNGRSIRPTFDLGGDVFVNPAPGQLEDELRQRGLLPK
jgi:mycoredoxin